MNTKSRISSILKAHSLDAAITGLPAFSLSELNLIFEVDLSLPTNLRLGHLAEFVVSGLIKASMNYKVLYENIQLMEEKRTVGEVDFIIRNIMTKQLLHVELAYKFYLYDPSISSDPIDNWIGPNRNDSLIEKVEKIKVKQFPLLYHSSARSKFEDLALEDVFQVLCLLVSLYMPYEYKGHFRPGYKKAIKGYYVTLEQFLDLDNAESSYYLPSKLEWGMDPAKNNIWLEFLDVLDDINLSIKEKQSLLCWQKLNGVFTEFFIVWW